MAKTLAQLRATVYALLREDNPQVVGSNPNTHFSDSTVVDGFLNDAQMFAGVFIEYPRDLVSVQAQNNVGSYTNPSDNLIVRTAYFGDSSVPGDILPLKIVSEETLRGIFPSWLDQSTSGTADRPQYMIQLDRKTIHVFPRPNGVGSVSGKKVWLNYNYNPAAMVNDSDTPDLPLPYHDLLPLYALHLCYYALQNKDMIQQSFGDFMNKVKLLKSAVTKETKEAMGFAWDYSEFDVESSLGGVLP